MLCLLKLFGFVLIFFGNVAPSSLYRNMDIDGTQLILCIRVWTGNETNHGKK